MVFLSLSVVQLVATISDKSTQIRSGAMEVLGLKQLPNTKLYIESLLANLNLHPQVFILSISCLFSALKVVSNATIMLHIQVQISIVSQEDTVWFLCMANFFNLCHIWKHILIYFWCFVIQ